MRSKQFVLLLTVIFTAFCALNFSVLSSVEDVKKGETAGSYPEEWYEMVSEEANRKGIRIFVDGEEKKMSHPAVMTATGSFLLPVSELTEVFSCTAHIYGQTSLVMEKNMVRAEIIMGEKRVTVTEASQKDSHAGQTGVFEGMEQSEKRDVALSDAITKEEGELWVSAQAVSEAFSYEMSWEPDENILSFTGLRPELEELPEVYDYRLRGRAPAVKNQGSLGTCWAFASLMALESRLLPEKSFDFSEDHMSIRNSFRMNQNDGGEYTMSMAYLLAWQGPVLEQDDPYGDSWSPPGLSPVRHVQEIQVLPKKDYEAIKRAVYFTGGVQSSLYTSMADGEENSEYYNKEPTAMRETENPTTML